MDTNFQCDIHDHQHGDLRLIRFVYEDVTVATLHTVDGGAWVFTRLIAPTHDPKAMVLNGPPEEVISSALSLAEAFVRIAA